jgi:streptogrisin C
MRESAPSLTCDITSPRSPRVEAEPDLQHELAAQRLASDWGVTYDEALVRVGRQLSLTEASALLERSDPESFSGSFFDQANGGRLVVTFTRLGIASKVVASLDDDVRSLVELRQVRSTMTTLIAQGQELWASLSKAGTVVNDVSVDNRTNQLVVNLPARDRVVSNPDGGEANYRAVLDVVAASGSGARVLEESGGEYINAACRADHEICDPPLRGGLEMAVRTNGGGLGICTSGFNVVGDVSTNAYQLTAGHCLDNSQGGSGTSVWWTRFPDASQHNLGARNGSKWKNVYPDPATACPPAGTPATCLVKDYGIISIDNPAGWQANPPKSYILMQAWDDDIHPVGRVTAYTITGSQSSSFPPDDSYVCKTGASTHTTCGAMLGKDVGSRVKVRARTCQGDSGGPVFADHLAYGLVTEISDSSLANDEKRYYTWHLAYPGLEPFDVLCTSFTSGIMHYQGVRAALDDLGVHLA